MIASVVRRGLKSIFLNSSSIPGEQNLDVHKQTQQLRGQWILLSIILGIMFVMVCDSECDVVALRLYQRETFLYINCLLRLYDGTIRQATAFWQAYVRSLNINLL